MIDFIEYVVAELQSKRLSKTHALSLIRQFGSRRAASNALVMHPLVHRNTSDLTQQSYGSRFEGTESFLRDHRVQGSKVLPGVAYLEMARAAISHALPDRPQGAVFELRNVVWAQPIVVDKPTEVMLAVFPEQEPGHAADQLGFEIYSTHEQEIVHCQGQALFSAATVPVKRDVSALRDQSSQQQLEAPLMYAAMLATGVAIGPSHRGVKTIHRGEQQLLAEIVLPDVVSSTLQEYVLHPSVLDSAVQAATALIIDPSTDKGRPPLPFALESLRVFSGCTQEMFAWVRYSSGSRPEDRVIKVDIDLCDVDGNVCVQLLGFSSRVLGGEAKNTRLGTVLAAPTWEVSEAGLSNADDGGYAQWHVILLDLPAVDVAQLRSRVSSASSVTADYSDAAVACFEAIQGLLKSKPHGRVLVQVVAPESDEGLLFAGLGGLLRTATRENPQLATQMILTRGDISADDLMSQLHREGSITPEPIVRYTSAGRSVRRWQALNEAEQAQPAFKNDGVYLITGGLGGVGLLFASEILARTSAARVILTGRASPSADTQATIEALGPRALYRQLDLENADHVTALVASIIEEHGQLNGILHSAGMVQDNFILKKGAAEFRDVLAPKVAGTIHLDRATAALDLDFLALFSSVSAVFGNPGQADYTAANGFMDAFATYRNRLVASKQRRGLSVSINWPLWLEGGMRLDPVNQEQLRQTTGMHPMRTETGMQAFYRSLLAHRDQILVVEGDLAQLQSSLLSEQSAPQKAEPVVAIADSDLIQQAQDYLRKQFSVVLKLASHRIDAQAALEKYGIDSIVAMDLTAQLELTFGSLPKTLFFEYQTIRELTDYFVREHRAKLSSLLTKVEGRVEEKPLAPKPQAVSTSRRRKRTRHIETARPASAEPIAIVGLSGRYPQSVDLDAYWQNLRDAKDCITEVPKERWDWRDYFTEDRTAQGAHYSKWGGFITGVDEFDPLFFNIPPVDAELIDPQERLFLQHAWMAIEDAGYTRASLQIPHEGDLAGQVGVYVGVMYGEYQLFGAEASSNGQRIGLPVSYASIANRVSYLLNLHGPSMALDTMCSSSLSAIHLACQDLKQGRTHLAIAGGVNVSVHPNKYLVLSSGQYISSDGHCRSFGAGGDGYIPGEGVGVVVLKRLSDARRDGNHIYGLIRGTALNHGGKTNGYTVPNLPAQASVISRAFKECGVDVRHVSYIEAHGTGTKLGDPIEVAALTHAFRQCTQDNQFCLLGSAKSNIGHCESAAGIAGLTKVLLQMKHRQIVPSLHSAQLNPHIDFAQSPFVVNQSLRPWEQPEIDGTAIPRIAGISSFGAGGSNAHVIVEEHSAAIVEQTADRATLVFPLSARTQEQMRHKARDLAAFIERQHGEIDLRSIAYTLQVGREAMDVRLGLVADSPAQLAEKLRAYVQGETNIEDVFQGRATQDEEGVAALGRDEDVAEALDKWIARGKFSKLLELWVKGLEVDWRKLYGDRKPRLCSLPTYPFAKERYWITPTPRRAQVSRSGTDVLHPLVHTNTSDLHQQSYATVFTGDERVLTDHQVETGGARLKILPGVAYLEMVRAAVELALPTTEPRSLELQNTAWLQPLIVDGEQQVCVSLLASDATCVDFEVASGTNSQIVHCQGRVAVRDASAPARHDIDALKAKMTRGLLAAEKMYDSFAAMGIHYGAAFRCLTAVQRGQRQLLAELTLDDGNRAQMAGYTLHPGLLDSALQAALGLIENLEDVAPRPAVPFALDALKIHAPLTSRMYAWVRGDITKVDIDLCDENGVVCVQIVGLASRTLTEPQKKSGSLIARPSWESSPLDFAAADRVADSLRRVVVLCDFPTIDAARLAGLLPQSRVKVLDLPRSKSLADRYRHAAVACFDEVQALLKSAPAEKVLFQVVASDELLAGLSGLIRTARIENPNVVGQVILSSATDEATLARQLRAAQVRSDEALIKYEQGQQGILRWHAETLQDAGQIAFRSSGVYVITGGLGGLGVAFAKEILARGDGTRVILTGRTDLDGSKHSTIANLAADASVSSDRIAYRQLDLSRLEDVQRFVASIVADFGAIHGVIHSAGMIQDRLIAHKSRDELCAVLEPKVTGTANLDLATSAIELDFLMLCSSMSAVFGNAGQADYAAANGFLDEFSNHRNELVRRGHRRGQTLSINWPLWEEGGMRLDRDAADLLARRTGIVPMKTQTGLQAFHRGIQLQASRTLVVEGDVTRLRQLLEPSSTVATPEHQETTVPAIDSNELLVKMQQLLGKQLATLLKLPPHEVDPKAPLERYGMDSVLAMKWTNQLEQLFGSLSKTLLFEHQTIASLASYLLKAFPRGIQEQTRTSTVVAKASARAPLARSLPVVARSARSKSRFVRSGKAAVERDVAIIGVSGRYPLAADLQQFWENLKTGRDCITEIPDARWNHRALYHPERNQPGKSYSKWGGFLDGVDQFDPLFFNISPREAELIDPQERLFLETVWETIEDAGYSKDAIARHRVGVFVGVMWGQYELYGAAGARNGVPSSSFASIANRVSYFFDFHGPSLALDTMCSSSLTAIHLASEEIRKGAIDVAIAGGVNVSIHPNKYLSLSQGNFASTDGRCRSFGAGGDGYVPGEGVGAVLLKSLEQALADGDQIYAIVKASSINHGGKTNGYTVPNSRAQADVIAQALANAQIEAATLGYVETHGTGTSLGDPIEITGLMQAFSGAGSTRSCAIGSVKSNIGHLESAAGIAAVTKVLLQLKHRQLVPSLHAEPANPNIDFTQTPFRVQTKLEEWHSAHGLPRRAGVSSFGAGGANAHLILEEFIDTREPWLAPERPEIVVLSAKSRASLVLHAEKMLAFLHVSSDVSLAQVAYTSQVGRTAMHERLVIIASSVAVLRDKLSQWLRDSAQNIDDIYEGSLKDSRSNAAALLDGQIGQELIRLTLENRDLAKLAQLWIAGAEIDWVVLHGANPPRKVSLPTYPFIRQRYWIDVDSPVLSAVQSEPTSHRELMYYRPEWCSAELVSSDSTTGLGLVMILDTDDRLLSQLDAENSCILVKPAAKFERVGSNAITVDWNNEADVSRLVETLQAAGSLPRTFIHHDVGSPEQAVYALHHLCKALMRQKLNDGVRILSVRANAIDEHAAMHAALGGFFRTLNLENPKFAGKVVEAAPTAELIRRELAEPSWKNSEVRYFDACRQVRALQRFAPAKQTAAGTGLKQGGVYLVTGGLGGLGYIFSEYLAQQYQARLVLIGRSRLDGEQERKFTRLASYSNEAIYREADVTNAADIDAVVREIKQKYSRLDGIIHAAGMHHDAYILNKTAHQMQAVLAAKVAGTIHLDQATADDPPDLFILFSSLAGALGNPGQSDYAFANSFLDAFAARRQQSRAGRTLSINWPFWEDGGMSLAAGNIELIENRTGVAPLRTEQGLQCFEALLGSDCTQALAINGVAAKVDAYVLNRLVPERRRSTEASARAVEAGELTGRTVSYLQSLLAKETKLAPDQVDPHERFESFGIDSMMISRINAVMEADLGELPKTLFYEYSTLQELADHLVQAAESSLTRLFDLRPAAVESEPRMQVMPDHSVSEPEVAIAELEPIAIIGLHGSFPHSETLEDYWENLRTGKDLVDAVPASRWDWREFFDADPSNAKDGKIYCASGGFLPDVDKFDAAFFQISPQDARLMDPQERLFLQSTWAAIEDAGYTRESLKRYFPKARSADVGVFVGVTTNTYHLLTPEEWSRGNMVTPGSLPWSIANRVSYFFDFQGPSLPVDTACSSSLVAMQLACDSLRRGECQVAIAGGVNLYLHPSKYQSFCSRRMLALEGKCRSFGAGDDGFIPGEAVGALVLKPLSKALEHGDHIYALVAASVSEHSGRSNGYSAPNPNSQANLIAQALSKAGLSGDTIGYIEGHGTGTQLGDSLEIASLTQAFQRTTDRKQFCAIGSVKANVGHAESAAGIAGVAKVLLQMKHGEIAPTIHSDTVNPNIDFKGSPFYLQHALTAWQVAGDQPRRAMINAFGAGGVNSCVILQEYRREAVVASGPKSPQLVVLSAKTSDALRNLVVQLRKFLSREPSVDMTRLAYTLQVGREAMSERLAVVASDAAGLMSELDKYLAGATSGNSVRGRADARRGRKDLQRSERSLAELARAWVEGQQIEWEGFYTQQRPVRLSLPTYPFARERHWVSDAPSRQKRSVAQLHPLVTANVSTLKEIAFSSMLSSTEYYARDHKVNGEMFFPGAGLLEIACINGTIAGERKVTGIRDLVWSQPLRFAAASRMVKTFLKSSGDATEYVIVSLDEDNERVVHSEGRLLYAPEGRHRADAGAVATIQSLRARCSRVIERAECYRTFEQHGLQYGETFQTIQELHVGDGCALAKLRLGDALLRDFDHYVLHPCLIDGALQSVIGLASGGASDSPYLPFALDEVEILRPLPPSCFAYVEPVPGQQHPDIRRFNITLLNESGHALVKLNHFNVRALRATRSSPPADTARALAAASV